MKQRIFSLMLAVAMLLSMVPVGVWAAEPVWEAPERSAEATGAEGSGEAALYAAPEDEGIARYAAPIEISDEAGFLKMAASGSYRLTTDIKVNTPYASKFSGTFDGGGHTITLNLNVTSGNAGLFAELVSGATIQNLNLTGSVTSSVRYGSVGSLAGKVTGSTVLKNCTASASVSALSDATCYVGGLIGQATQKVTATDCTASGTVDAQKGYAGGFVGYVSSSGSIFTNCNALGTARVGGKAEKSAQAYGFANIPYSSVTFVNCTYGAGNDAGCNKTSSGLTQYVDPNAKFTVTLTVVPATATLTWDGAAQARREDGVYVLLEQAIQDHTYQIIPAEGDDLAAAEGTIQVKNGDVSQTITLAAKTYALSFRILPESVTDAKVTVKNAKGSTQTASSGYVYTVPSGVYSYTVSAYGYQDAGGEATVDRKDTSVPVTLTEKPYETVTFSFTDETGKVTVNEGYKTLSAQSDGSYKLYAGGTYTWAFTSDTYIEQSGEIDLRELKETGTRTVTISLKEKPKADAEGVYHLKSAGELAWFAAQVNAGKLSNAKVELANDIDLGGRNWTPIGRNYSYSFKGTFDGKGFEVKNLQINATEKSQALFGYVNGGTVRNLTVSGSVTSNKDDTAGIVATLTGNGLVENCINRVNVKGTMYTGGVVGDVTSGNTNRIENCVNHGTVEGSSPTGGILGRANYGVVIVNVYNRGLVSGSSNTGGIVGQLSDRGAKLSNAYTTGTDMPAVGKKTSGTVDTATVFYLGTAGTDANATAKSETELKAAAGLLGRAFVVDGKGLNDGFPLLKFQIPTFAVTFTLSETAKVSILSGETVIAQESGAECTVELPEGTYRYRVEKFGKKTLEAEFTVGTEGSAFHLTLENAATQTVTITVTPEQAEPEFTATWNGETVTVHAGENQLPAGTYQYLVRAAGYANARGTFTVAERAVSVQVALTESSAWDGESVKQPSGEGTEDKPYLIGSGEELAWLAQDVNRNGSSRTYAVKLTADIDLGGQSKDAKWTPIGKGAGYSFVPFKGTFDGDGHVISGMDVDAEYAGLFGAVENATIRNVIVRGTVNGTAEAGGIVARVRGGTNVIENCGNEAAVSGKLAGGIVGNNFGSSTKLSVRNCYNSGTVTSNGTASDRAAGILAQGNGTYTTTDCYNVGRIVSNGYAFGIGASGPNSKISNSYHAGTVSSSANADRKPEYAISSGSYSENCYYVQGNYTNAQAGTAMTLVEMQETLLGKLNGTSGTNWKCEQGRNQDLPVLAWQTDAGDGGEEANLLDAAFDVEEVYEDDAVSYEIVQPTLRWSAAEGASAYVVSLWKSTLTWTAMSADERAAFDKLSVAEQFDCVDEIDVQSYLTAAEKAQWQSYSDAFAEQQSNALKQTTKADYDAYVASAAYQNAMRDWESYVVQMAVAHERLGSYARGLGYVGSYRTAGTSYDFTQVFAAKEEAEYYAAVSVVDASGAYALPDAETVELYIAGYQSPYNRLKPVTGLRWDGTKAIWDAKQSYGSAQYYTVKLYVMDSGTAEWVNEFYVPGNYHTADLSKYMAAGHKYAFSVYLDYDGDFLLRTGLMGNVDSALSKTIDPSQTPGDKEYVKIATADDWMAVAGVKDEQEEVEEGVYQNKQQIAWGKNYELVADLDFSTLTAAQQAKSKTIGSETYPFMGEFKGNGHKITGLTLANSDAGLFGDIGVTGSVHDLVVEKPNVLFSDNAAVLVFKNHGVIERCAVLDANITADTGAVLGGMVSRNYGMIRDSYVQGGRLVSNSLYATGHAGFAGSNETGGLIERCWTSMEIKTQSDYAGGFVGLGYGGTIRNCFALGNVSARSYSGGFLGRSVFDGNVYENCYAAGTVTVTGEEGHGFIGGNKPDSSFQYDQSKTVTNCWYNAAAESAAENYGAKAKSAADMATDEFVRTLNTDEEIWTRKESVNGGLPYFKGKNAPEEAEKHEITVTIDVAVYDKETYTFQRQDETITVKLNSNGNSTVVDVMDQAVADGTLTYSYTTSVAYGRYIEEIGGHRVEQPDGWMFTINNTLSNVSASIANVKDQDKILWFEGTAENRYQGPTLEELDNAELEWIDISSAAQLEALAASEDDAALAKNYRLTADIDLNNALFAGIGSAAHPFTGVFDGQNKTVSNVNIQGAENAGFFNVVLGGTVKNLKLRAVSVSGQKDVGALVGLAGAALDTANPGENVATLIGNCTAQGTVNGTEAVGGLVGKNDGKYDAETLFSIASSIHGSSFRGTVNAVGGNAAKIGGLVGGNAGNVNGCAADGSVNAKAARMVGGLAGENSGTIADSHADAAVIGRGNVGGFVGSSSGSVKNSYSLGNVTGTEYAGGFAGSISAVDTALSAGTATQTGATATGYVGGFAGTLNGTISGTQRQINVRDIYANCTQGENAALAAIGNGSKYQSESDKAVLANAQLTSWRMVCEAAKTLFGLELPCPELEVEKYEDSVSVDGAIAAGSVIRLMKAGQTASGEMETVLRAEGDELEVRDGALYLKQKNAASEAVSRTVAVEVTDARGNRAQKQITVTIAPSAAQPKPGELSEDAKALLHNIASRATSPDASDGNQLWYAMDMVTYAALPEAKAQLSTAGKTALMKALTALAYAAKNPANDRAKAEILLSALGVDTTALTAEDGTVFNNAAELAKLDMAAVSHYTAPYVLLADLQGRTRLTDAQVGTLIATLERAMGSGLFENVYAGVTYTDVDTASAALAALARFYGTRADAKRVVDKILAALPDALDDNGSFGNANTDAMAIIGLLAMGKSLTEFASETGKTLESGLLRYANAEKTAFVAYNYATGAVEDNVMATEQGFRALLALARYDGTATNIYDFSWKTPATVKAVIAAIDALSPVDETSGAAIAAARAAYESLTAEEQSEVTNYRGLQDAENVYKALLTARKAELLASLAGTYASYDLTKYSQTGLTKLANAYRQGVAAIRASETIEAAELALNEAVRAMNAVKAGKIDVTFRLIGDNAHGSAAHEEYVTWIVTTRYEVDEGATVGELFSTATQAAGLRTSGTASGYVSSIVSPAVLGGETLSEFTNGANSGWMYTVNGAQPQVGMNSYTLQNGDAVVWYYTDNYQTAGTPWLLAADITPEQFVQQRLGRILSVGLHGSATPTTLTTADLGRTVTFTFKPDAGYRVKNVTVDGKSIGSVTSYTVPKLSIYTRISVEFTNGKLPFADVQENDWFYDDVVYVYEAGLFSGTSDTLFSPYAPMTRAMLVTVLYRLEGQPVVYGRSGFADVTMGSYYENAVTWAANNGIVDGTSATTFNPNANVTREQMAAILCRYAQYKRYSTAASSALSGFADAAAVADYAKTAMQWAVGAGLLNGAAGRLLPKGNAKRAEVAAILHRFAMSFAK